MRYYWSLDLLRFVSAFLVLLFHIAAFGGGAPSWPVDAAAAPLGWLTPVSWFGWVGVQVFFVLSGFIISASAYDSTALDFLRKRAIRVFPALWISAVLALVVRAIWGEPLADLVPDLLRSAILSPKGPYIDGVVWSLVIEAIFYAGVAAVILVAPRFGGLARSLTLAAFALGIASTCFNLVHWLAVSGIALPGPAGMPASLQSFAFDVLLLRHGVLFAVGILLYQIVQHRPSPHLVGGLALFTAAGALQIANKAHAGLAGAIPVAFWLAGILVIYLGARFGSRAFAQRLRPIMRPIGLMTYPLYLNHFVLGQALLPVLALFISNSLVLAVVLCAIILANAWFIARFPERWLQRIARTVLFRPSAAPVGRPALEKS